MGEETQLHLRWHSHSLTFTGMLHDLHVGRAYTDVSMICEGGVVRAHRAVLSLCSPYLSTVLGTCSENDDAPLVLPEIPVQDIRYLISFIYRGQVDVPQTQIASFLNTGKHLQVLGLEQGDQLVGSPEKSEGSTTPPPGGELDDDETPRNILGNNNKGEFKDKLNDGMDGFAAAQKIFSGELKPSLKRELEKSVKVEDIKVENDMLGDGRIDLNYYLQQAIQSASMPCPLCKKEFKSQSGLRDHIRLHTGERPFVCDFCNMNFARASHLKRHRRMHTGEKPFECSVCGKDFSRGDKLKDHLRRHEAENKIQQIRTQILNLDEVTSDAESANGGLHSSFQGVLQGSSSGTNTLIPSVSTPLAALTPITSLTTSVASPQLLLSKLQSASFQDGLQPPAKRPCTNLKLAQNPLGQFPHSLSQFPGFMSSQENSSPQGVLGVTSIGECILRPIN